MRIKFEAATEIAPKGKRSIRETVYGNTNAYISGKFWKTIGITHAAGTAEDAAAFLAEKD